MGLVYPTTAYVQGDSFPVLIRKMAQKLGVPVDIGDNVYKVMWKVLADQSWSLGSAQPYLNVANQNVTFSSLPSQGDTLNVLFLKFAIRTGYVIVPSRNLANVAVLRAILSGSVGPTPPTPPTTSYTLTYSNPFGTISGTNPQTVLEGADGTPVEAVPSLSLAFVQWSDGNVNNPRTDTNVSADVTVSADTWTEVAYGGTIFSDFEDLTDGDELNGAIDGDGWWDAYTRETAYASVIHFDDLTEYSAGDLSGNDGGDGWGGAWETYGSGAAIETDFSENAISIADGGILRPLNGESWTHTRIVIRYRLEDTGGNITGTPFMAIGLCSGNTNPFDDVATTTHFLGYGLTKSSFTWNSGDNYNCGISSATVLRRVATTNTTVSIATGGIKHSGSSELSGLVFSIERAAPNYLMDVQRPNAILSVATFSDTDQFEGLWATTPAFTGYSSYSDRAIAMDETPGALNYFNVFWNPGSDGGKLFIHDIVIRRIT